MKLTAKIRRCDATCHNAKHPKCGCICGGKFHGAAVRRDMTTERQEMEDVVLSRAVPAPAADDARQPNLFEDVLFELTKGN